MPRHAEKALFDRMKTRSEACKEGFKGAYQKYVTERISDAHCVCRLKVVWIKIIREQGFSNNSTKPHFQTNPIHPIGAAFERWMVDAFDGTLIDLEPETLKGLMPDSRRFDPHHERHSQFRSSEIGRCRQRLGTNLQSGIKRSEAGTIQLEDNLLLVLEDTESLPFESEPVFWMD